MAGLTVLKCKHAKPGRHGDGNGLYLLVSRAGAKSWMIRIQANGRRRDIGIGSYSDVTLEEAREKAGALRKVARSGGDPIAVRDKAQNVAPTFKEAAIACHNAQAPGWTDRHSKAFLSTLELHAFKQIGKLRVDSIDERDLVTVLSPIWTNKPSAARKIRQRLGLVLDYAKASGWRATGAPRESLGTLLSKQAEPGNYASMPYEVLPPFVAKQKAASPTIGRLALLFTILTAARNGEVREAKWSHINLDEKVWNRPAELMRKTNEAHTVTLSPEAMQILEDAAKLRTVETDCLVFPGASGKALSDMTLSKIVRPTGFTVHGFRSSFRTWSAERMHQMPEAVCEAALSHKIPDRVVRAYNRAKFLDMRRTLMDAWGRYASGSLGDVIQLPLGLRA